MTSWLKEILQYVLGRKIVPNGKKNEEGGNIWATLNKCERRIIMFGGGRWKKGMVNDT